MSRHESRAALFSLEAALVVLASLGLVTPGLLGRTQGEKATKDKPIAALQLNAPQVLVGTKVRMAKGDEKQMSSPEAKAQGVAARKAVVAFKKALAQNGVYNCCIRPGCEFCPDAADLCPCATSLRKSGPVCPECWGGWQAGKGRLPGVKPADVMVLPEAKLKMMYDMWAKKFEQAQN